jgi:hypothetical protein
MAVVGGTIVTYLQNPMGNLWMIIAGVVLAVLAKISSAVSHHYRYASGPTVAASSSQVSVSMEDVSKETTEAEELDLEAQASSSPKPEGTNAEKSEVIHRKHSPGSSTTSTKESETTVIQVESDETKIAVSVPADATKRPGNMKVIGVVYALCAGICFSIWPYFFDSAKAHEQETAGDVPIHLTNYSCFFVMLFSGTIFVLAYSAATIVALPSLTRTKINWHDYYDKSKLLWHPIALVGGMVWASGAWCNFIGAESVGFTISYFLAQASVLITATVGWVFFGEYNNSTVRSKVFLGVFYGLYVAAVVFIALAAIY